MGQIVCISKDTVRKDICEIDDIVGIHEDDVSLTGVGYIGFNIVKIVDKTVTEITAFFKYPKIKEVDSKTIWLDSKGKWYELLKQPKYSHTIQELNTNDLLTLLNKKSDKSAILNKIQEKIHLIEVNNTIPSKSEV